MARTAATKKRRGLIVSSHKFSFNGVKMEMGDEFDPIELKLHDSKVIQLVRARRIKFGEIKRSFDMVQQLHQERLQKILLKKENKKKDNPITIELTTSGGGWYAVFVDGVTVGDGKMRKDEAIEYVEKYHPDLLESVKEKF